MKTTIDLPEDLVREIKIRAAREGRKMKEVAAQLLRRGLDQGMTRSAPASEIENHSPIVYSPANIPMAVCREDAPAIKMTIEQLLKMEQDSLHAEDAHDGGLPL